jgi:hypothetical protein
MASVSIREVRNVVLARPDDVDGRNPDRHEVGDRVGDSSQLYDDVVSERGFTKHKSVLGLGACKDRCRHPSQGLDAYPRAREQLSRDEESLHTTREADQLHAIGRHQVVLEEHALGGVIGIAVGYVEHREHHVESAPSHVGDDVDAGVRTQLLRSSTTTTLFVDNGDGTVTDTQTGRQWEKKGNNGGLHDVDNRYAWAGCCNDDCTTTANFCQPNAAAAAACAAGAVGTAGCAVCASGTCTLNPAAITTIWDWLVQVNAEGGSGFAGHNDWRIPEVNRDGGSAELETITVGSPGCSPPCVGPAFNSGCTGGCSVLTCSCTGADYYWSSVTSAADPDDGWVVHFADTGVDPDGKFIANFVRAVRGGS